MEQDAGPMPLIWVKPKAEYFSRRDWTTQISLIRLDKLVFSRKPEWRWSRCPGGAFALI
jgi:hypothetical protein